MYDHGVIIDPGFRVAAAAWLLSSQTLYCDEDHRIDTLSFVKRNVLLPVLHVLCYASILFSQEFCAQAVHGYFGTDHVAKGNAFNLDDYRAIAVDLILGRLYAVVLNTQLFLCAERNGKECRRTSWAY